MSASAISLNPLLWPISVIDSPRPEHIHIQYYDCWYHFENLPGTFISLLRARYFYNLMGIRCYLFVRNQHHVFIIAIVTGECTILILQKYVFKVCVILFSFYSIQLLSWLCLFVASIAYYLSTSSCVSVLY